MDRQGGNKAMSKFLEAWIFTVPHFLLNKSNLSSFMFLNRERPYMAHVNSPSSSMTRLERFNALQAFQTPIGTWDVL